MDELSEPTTPVSCIYVYYGTEPPFPEVAIHSFHHSQGLQPLGLGLSLGVSLVSGLGCWPLEWCKLGMAIPGNGGPESLLHVHCTPLLYNCMHCSVGIRQLQLYWWREHKYQWCQQYCGAGSMWRHYVPYMESRCLFYYCLTCYVEHVHFRTLPHHHGVQVLMRIFVRGFQGTRSIGHSFKLWIKFL